AYTWPATNRRRSRSRKSSSRSSAVPARTTRCSPGFSGFQQSLRPAAPAPLAPFRELPALAQATGGAGHAVDLLLHGRRLRSLFFVGARRRDLLRAAKRAAAHHRPDAVGRLLLLAIGPAVVRRLLSRTELPRGGPLPGFSSPLFFPQRRLWFIRPGCDRRAV